MINNKYSKVLCFALSISVSMPVISATRFEYGTRGYLMDACQDALDQKNTFASGYCYGVYSTVMDSKLIGLTKLGTTWCPSGPNAIDSTINFGIIIKWLKDHPKQWATGETYYAIELALKEAYPCK